MYSISGLGPVGLSRSTLRSRGGALFSMPGEPPTEAAVAAAAVAMPSLLALQESETDAVRDREARQHGASVLEALTELQLALLGGDGSDGLQRMAALARAAPAAADPRLAAVQRALSLRVAVELARRRAAASL